MITGQNPILGIANNLHPEALHVYNQANQALEERFRCRPVENSVTLKQADTLDDLKAPITSGQVKPVKHATVSAPQPAPLTPDEERFKKMSARQKVAELRFLSKMNQLFPGESVGEAFGRIIKDIGLRSK